jgi:Carboxypeptidase regulatory-like domain
MISSPDDQLLRYSSPMRWRFLGSALLIFALFAPFRSWTQGEMRSVTIHVIDQFGTPIPHAQIRFIPVGGSVQTVLETDEHGNRSFNLEAGSHALSISSPGFKVWSESIYVPEPSDNPVYSVVLQIGPNGGAFIVYPEAALLVIDNASHVPVALSATDFRALPHITMTVHNGETNRDETYSGVALTTLLAMVNAPIGKAFRKRH